ncbi:MAG: hypothetical protein DRI56_00435 [Chloroflexota bacterium]|nr:MAG: hypothetical protein DRI56_00435 [Chloroflexota bacterium]
MKEALHILLAEDNYKVALPIEKILAKTRPIGKDIPDLKMTHVKNLREGLVYLDAKKIDVILLELDSQKEQIEEALANIQAHSPHIPVIVICQEDPTQRRLAFSAGAKEVLFQKEVSAPLLAHTLANAIMLAEIKKELQEARQEVQKRHAEFQAAYQASLHLTATLELQPVLEEVLQNALSLTSANDAHIFLYDGKHLKFGSALFDSQLQEKPYVAIRQNGITYNVAQSGERIVVNDMASHPLFEDQHWNGAILGLPLKIGDEVQGVMNIAFNRPHTFSENELRILQFLGDQATIAIHNARLYEQAQQEIAERKQIEESLRRSEHRYQKLFQSMTSAFAVHEVILDENAKPCDYRFLEVNSRFEQLVNIKAEDLIGRTVLEVIPGIGSYWIQRFGWVAITGKATYFEDYSPDLKKHYAVTAYCPQEGQFATLFTDITARKLAGQALRESEERYRKLFASSKDAIMTLEPPDWKFTSGNPAILKMFNIKDEEKFTSFKFWEISPEKQPDGCRSIEKAKEMLQLAMNEGSNFFEWTHKRLNGEEFPATVLLTRVDLNERAFLLATVRDITVRRKAENALRESEEKYRTLFEHIPVGLYLTTPEGQFLDANPAIVKMLGHQNRESLLETEVSNLFVSPKERKREKVLLEENETIQGFEMQMRRRDGAIIWVQDTAQVIRDDKGQILYYQGSLEDITERKRMAEAIKHMATHDALTDLPNRRLFNDRMKLEMAHASRNRRLLGVLLFDLDGFKLVNDTLGHSTGDKLLKILSKRLLSTLRESDTIARMGGDEFLVILPDIDDKEDAAQTAQRILETIHAPFTFNGHKIHLTTSIGVAFFPDDGEDVDTLVKNADIAMYRAKDQEGNRYCYYGED